MAENTQENASMTSAAAEFMKAIENKASNDELKTLIDSKSVITETGYVEDPTNNNDNNNE